MIIQRRHFATIIVWFGFGIFFISGTDTIPEDYHLAVDVCKESDISHYCDIIEKTALGKNTTEICNSLQLHLNESSTFTTQCIMIFTGTDKYIIGPYFIYLMLYRIWWTTLFFTIYVTIGCILDSNGLDRWLVNNYAHTLKKIYVYKNCLEGTFGAIAITLIVFGINQTWCDHVIATSQTTIQMREIAGITCRRYFNTECSIMEHTMYTNNDPKGSCTAFGSIHNWTATQKSICTTIFSPVRMDCHNCCMSDNNYLLMIIYLSLIIAIVTLNYLVDIKKDVERIFTQSKNVT
jgi:hypothetical protein